MQNVHSPIRKMHLNWLSMKNATALTCSFYFVNYHRSLRMFTFLEFNKTLVLVLNKGKSSRSSVFWSCAEHCWGVPLLHLHGETEGRPSLPSLFQALLLQLHPSESQAWENEGNDCFDIVYIKRCLSLSLTALVDRAEGPVSPLPVRAC